MNIFGPVKCNQNELQNAVAGNLSTASAPVAPKAGQFYFDTTQLTTMFNNGTSWVPADASKLVGAIPFAALTSVPVDLVSAQTIAGIKTFTAPPVFSGASIAAGTIALAALASAPVDLVSAQTIGGIKTFTAPPIFSGASITAGTVPFSALASVPVDLVSAQTIGGVKTFSVPPVFSGAAIATGSISNAALLVNPLARANHTGTQLSATISDLASVVQAYPLSAFAVPIANVPFNAKNITNLLDPVNPQDASTKNYVDVNIQLSTLGISSKPSVAVVATANQAALSGLPTIDGVTLSTGQRILLTGQTNAAQNGVYTVAAGAWAQVSGDPSGGAELSPGAFWFVELGAVYASSQWRLATPTTGTITPGTTPVTITQFGQALTYTATNGVAVNGLAFSGVVAPAGGVLAGATGFSLDPTVAARKYSTTIGDGSTLVYTITHNLGTLDVVASVRDLLTTNEIVYPTVAPASTNTVTVTWTVAPATNGYRVTVLA